MYFYSIRKNIILKNTGAFRIFRNSNVLGKYIILKNTGHLHFGKNIILEYEKI